MAGTDGSGMGRSRSWKHASIAMVGAALITMGGACSAAPGTASSAAPGSAAADSPTTAVASVSSPAPTFVAPTTDCVLPAQAVASITGYSALVADHFPVTPNNPAELIAGCQYRSAGQVIILGVTLDPVQNGKTARDYLADDAAGSHYDFGRQHDVSGVGDVATFGTARCSSGTCGSVFAIAIRGGTVAHLVVAVPDPPVAEDKIVALARALLAAVSN